MNVILVSVEPPHVANSESTNQTKINFESAQDGMKIANLRCRMNISGHDQKFNVGRQKTYHPTTMPLRVPKSLAYFAMATMALSLFCNIANILILLFPSQFFYLFKKKKKKQ